MTKTQNYSLPQWEANDALKRTDFNEAMAIIDSIVTVGSYTGNGLELSAGGLHVELGFRPRFVIISRGLESYSNVTLSNMIITEHMSATASKYAFLDDSGFTIGQCASVGTYALKPNTADVTYSFVAFR